LHENPDHVKEANDKLNEYWECMLKDREDEKEKLVNKNQKLLKTMEAIKSQYWHLSIFLYFRYLYTHEHSIK
jgi:hypothetical protein